MAAPRKNGGTSLDQVQSLWNRLDGRRRAVIVGATIAMFAAVLLLSQLATRSDRALLYAGLDGRAAGDVIAALEQIGEGYDVRGDAIFVDSARRDALRMTLAGQGLPAAGPQGYELLDTLSGFGTTSQMFDAAYWRAKEGELARTIVASPFVRSARVHIAHSTSAPFRRPVAPSASVAVTTVGGSLTAAQAKALRYLVASAVAGLAPDAVSIMDGTGALVAGPEQPGAEPASAERAAAMKHNVERLLEARVGPGNAVVEISLTTATETEQITERRFDPESRVAISSETEERSGTSNDNGGGAVTVASNLPDGDAAGGGRESSSQNSETRERINFEVSETRREVLRAPGAITRLTIAVLVNGVPGTDAAGNPVMVPRPDDELAALRELVASAIGLDEARGDQLTLRSMPFEPLPELGSEAQSPGLFAASPLDTMRLVQLGVLAVVALVLGLFVLRPLLTRVPEPGLLAPASASASAPAEEALTAEIDPPEPAEALPVPAPQGELPALPPVSPEEAVARLRTLIDERQEDTLAILRGWMDDEEEPA